MLTILVAALLAADSPPPLLARPPDPPKASSCTAQCMMVDVAKKLSEKEWVATYKPFGAPRIGPFVVRTLLPDTIVGSGATWITLCDQRHEQQYEVNGFPKKVW